MNEMKKKPLSTMTKKELRAEVGRLRSALRKANKEVKVASFCSSRHDCTCLACIGWGR